MVTYVVELRPSQAEAWVDVPPITRLRRALKALGRAYGLRVVECEARYDEGRRGSRGDERVEGRTHG